MYRSHLIFRSTITFLFSICALVGCGGNKLLDNPQPLVLERPLMTAQDQRLEAHLDWVIVRNGPGTWAANANWDEYLLRVRNVSNEPIRITAAAVYDSLDTRLESSANLKNLISESRKTAQRYKGEHLQIRAGARGDALVETGAALYVGGTALGVTSLAGGASSGTAAAAVGAVVLAPVLIVGGMVQIKRTDWVAREIVSRYSPLPVDLASNELESMTLFFPLAPSPSHIELAYNDSTGTQMLSIDTREILQGLHMVNTEE